MKKITKLKLRFWAVYTVIGLAQPLALLFPIAWALRFLGKLNPLWIILDDSRLDESKATGLAVDYEIYLDDFKYNWVGVLAWHILRNRVWNLVELFSLPPHEGRGNQNIEILELIKDDLVDGYGNKIKQDGIWCHVAQLKYIGKKGQNPYQVNRGTIISKAHSTIGEGEIVYKDGSFEGWRYTSCKIVKPWWLFGGKRWLNIFLGTNANRYSIIYKYKKVVEWGEW